MAMTASAFFETFAASALTAASEFATWNGSREPGFVSDGMSSFEKPMIASRTPSWKRHITDGDHSFGVLPFASTMLLDTNGY